MRLERLIRLLAALLIALLALLAIGGILFLTRMALEVRERMSALPAWVWMLYVGLLLAVGAAGFVAVWKLVLPRRQRSAPARRRVSEAELRGRLADLEGLGLDVSSARRELAGLDRRREGGSVYVCMLGEISAGKSALIAAVLPGSDARVSPVGGSTLSVTHYEWRGESGDRVVLTDVPGTGLASDRIAAEEAARAHVVVFVCDADLTRAEYQLLETVLGTGKPLVVALNKSDRYGPGDLEDIRRRIEARLQQLAPQRRIAVVAVSAGAAEEVVMRSADGVETTLHRSRPADVKALLAEIRRLLAGDRALLESLRDRAFLQMAAGKLDRSVAEQRAGRAREIVTKYTRRAVVGALASVSPGTDLIVQGYLGSAMVKALCELYQVPVRDLEVERFLDLSQGQVGRATPLLLAVAGNGFKAFPGIGTVAGGLLHAVAYGLVFDALGRSLTATLSVRGRLEPAVAVEKFRETLHEDLDTRTERVAGMALEAREDAAEVHRAGR